MTPWRDIRCSPRYRWQSNTSILGPGLTARALFFVSFPPSLKYLVGLTLSLILGSQVALAESDRDQSYLTELQTRAHEAQLANARYWHVLLHYRANLLGGYTSEADEPGFFLAPNGKTDPQAELEATLRQMFSDELVGRSKQPAQCAFVARYHWLKEQLSIDDRRLQPLPCPRFQAWLKGLDAQGVSLIFPSAYMNNPSSMFGHILLRVDQKGQTDQTRILAYTINYAADVTNENPIMFAIGGIFGKFKGYFSTMPYYLKVQEYRDLENRDIWEYRLNFTQEQLDRMLMHAWEMGNASFDYFFFKENCAYHILSLLEAANPDLHLTDRFVVWTVPADTVRVIASYPGLLGPAVYRPSRSTKLRRRLETLSGTEVRWLRNIAKDPALARSAAFTSLAPERQALILDVASDLLLYKSVNDADKAASYSERNRAVLMTRSKLKVKPDETPILPLSSPPEEGHKTSRAGLAVGVRNGYVFEELNVRAGYHDLLDPERGYTPDAQIELLSVAVRHYETLNQTRLERLTWANVISLSPIDALFQRPSWKVNVGLQSIRPTRSDASCTFCTNWNFNGGLGGAVEQYWVGREVFFAFAEVDANYSEGYLERHRVGGGGTAGMLATVTERWKMLLSTTYLRYPLGDRSEDWRASVHQRYTVQRNLALRLEYNHRYREDEALFTVQAYF